MNRWTHKLVWYSLEEVQRYCIRDHYWHMFKERLNSLPTDRKLDNLEIYRSNFLTHNSNSEQRRMEVQTSNYIDTLVLSGYLTTDLKVKK